jgi:glycosyltransferase involved in cell wall biosynthesis
MAEARRLCAHRVIAVSDSARALIVDGGWDRAERVVTIHNGVAAPAPRRPRAEVRAELGLADVDLAVMIIGVLRAGKGHAQAIDALELVAEQTPRARLVIVGDGPTRDTVEAAARGLGERVVLTGWRDDVPDLLAAADVLLHPTSADAFPTALLEAMAASLPIVATAVGGIPEIVDDGATGVLVPPPPRPDALAAALRPLLADVTLRAAMSRRARAEFERRFTAERWAHRLRALYDEVTAAAPRRRSTRSPIASIMRPATRSQVKRPTSRS